MMGARLERDIGRCPTRRRARLGQSLRLGMGAATIGRPATADNPALFDYNAADRRIGPDTPHPTPAKAQGQRHETAVGPGAHVSDFWFGRSSLTNLSKSPAAWKFL
jgi:hypothetical protein